MSFPKAFSRLNNSTLSACVHRRGAAMELHLALQCHLLWRGCFLSDKNSFFTLMQRGCDNWLLAAVPFPFVCPQSSINKVLSKGWNKKAALTCHLHFTTLSMLLIKHLPCSAELGGCMLGDGGKGRVFSTVAASLSGFVGHPESEIPCIVVKVKK